MKNIQKVALLFMVAITSCGPDDIPEGLDESFVVEYYNQPSPFVSPTPLERSSNLFVEGVSAYDDGVDAVIVFRGLKVQTKEANYMAKSFIIQEDRGNGFRDEYEFGESDSNVKTDIAVVLVLDMSTSLDSIIGELKSYSKDFVRTIVNSSMNSKVGIVFFNSRNNITTTAFYSSSNAEILYDTIDNYTNLINKTALFEATNIGIDLIGNLQFDGAKSIVVFSDGGNNDSANPEFQKEKIKASGVSRYTIGLKGRDFVESDLKLIASSSSQHLVAEDIKDLESIFYRISLGVVSVYELTYKRSNAPLNDKEKVKIKVNMWADIIK